MTEVLLARAHGPADAVAFYHQLHDDVIATEVTLLGLGCLRVSMPRADWQRLVGTAVSNIIQTMSPGLATALSPSLREGDWSEFIERDDAPVELQW